MIWQIPAERVLLEYVCESGFVGEEQREVGGEDAVLDVAKDLPVLVRVQLGENVVVFLNKINKNNRLFCQNLFAQKMSTCCSMLTVILKWWCSIVDVE